MHSLLSQLAVLAGIASTVNAIPTISVKGAKFFADGQQFLIKGVAYQGTPADPLVDTNQCIEDANSMAAIGTNSIRVYHVDPNANHDGCMNAFAQKGIYAWVDLDTFNTTVVQSDPMWTEAQFLAFTDVCDAFHKYDNLAGFFIGNEVINNLGGSPAAPYIKAATADMKAYLAAKNYRNIPIGYSAADIAELRPALQNYLACGNDYSQSIDFYGLNAYEWCGDATYQTSGYEGLQAMAEGYSIPLFFSETGCNVSPPRTFSDQAAIFGPDMIGTWSGSIIYEWVQETNDYGLVTYPNGQIYSGAPIPIQPDYDNLASQWKSISPAGVAEATYMPSLSAPSCPTSSGGWVVNGNVPIPTLGSSAVQAAAQSVKPTPSALPVPTTTTPSPYSTMTSVSSSNGMSLVHLEIRASKSSSASSSSQSVSSSSISALESSSSKANAFSGKLVTSKSASKTEKATSSSFASSITANDNQGFVGGPVPGIGSSLVDAYNGDFSALGQTSLAFWCPGQETKPAVIQILATWAMGPDACPLPDDLAGPFPVFDDDILDFYYPDILDLDKRSAPKVTKTTLVLGTITVPVARAVITEVGPIDYTCACPPAVKTIHVADSSLPSFSAPTVTVSVSAPSKPAPETPASTPASTPAAKAPETPTTTSTTWVFPTEGKTVPTPETPAPSPGPSSVPAVSSVSPPPPKKPVSEVPAPSPSEPAPSPEKPAPIPPQSPAPAPSPEQPVSPHSSVPAQSMGPMIPAHLTPARSSLTSKQTETTAKVETQASETTPAPPSTTTKKNAAGHVYAPSIVGGVLGLIAFLF